jgi:hypothetical protein
MLAFTPFVQVATYATRHFATFGLAPAAAPICDVLEMSLILTSVRTILYELAACFCYALSPVWSSPSGWLG